MVTIIPSKKIKNEASTIIGYAFKDGSKVTVDVEGKKFTMFTDKDNAWIENQAQEADADQRHEGRQDDDRRREPPSAAPRRPTPIRSPASRSALDAIAKACPVK